MTSSEATDVPRVPTSERDIALTMRGIEKAFGGVRALRGADLEVRSGEIMGLLGENGAGKSTLLKILSGVHAHGSYSGEVRVFGKDVALRHTRDAAHEGIAIVHQELMLVPELSVAANLALGREATVRGVLDEDAEEARGRELLERFGMSRDIDAASAVGELGIGLQQVVEIVRALSQDARILVLDEPTAALTSEEAARLLQWLEKLRERGTTCIYVSHRLDEVFALCDRITVLRDGKTEATFVTKDVTPARVVASMVGREVATDIAPEGVERSKNAPVVLDVQDLTVFAADGAGAPDGRRAVDRVSFALRKGEVLGIAGAMGSGRTALLSTLFGSARGDVEGTLRLRGEAVALGTPRDAIAHGFALLPEDRKGRGLVLEMSVAHNLTLPERKPRGTGFAAFLARLGFVDDEAEELTALARIRELSIRGTADAVVGTLSGGNQQKVVLGKWLETPPEVLLLDEPTRGVDVGAREEIYGLLESLARSGVSIVVASSDLAEIRRLAHRVLVLRHGRIAGELDSASVTDEAIVALSTGATGVPGAGTSGRSSGPGEARVGATTSPSRPETLSPEFDPCTP
ncbi:MAG: sugar ABC transporter ATP-binding protein [Polyangiaceae bacterium]